MAQALPRYCPRCGTPTRADMQLCATCGLPAGAMLSRPDNKQFGTDEYHDDAQQGAVVPTSRGMQQENDMQATSPAAWPQNAPANWNTTGQPAHQSQLPPMPPSLEAGGWNAPNQPPWSAQPDPWSSPGTVYPPDNPANQAVSWNPQSEPPLSPMPPTSAPKRQLRTGRFFWC